MLGGLRGLFAFSTAVLGAAFGGLVGDVVHVSLCVYSPSFCGYLFALLSVCVVALSLTLRLFKGGRTLSWTISLALIRRALPSNRQRLGPQESPPSATSLPPESENSLPKVGREKDIPRFSLLWQSVLEPLQRPSEEMGPLFHGKIRGEQTDTRSQQPLDDLATKLPENLSTARQDLANKLPEDSSSAHQLPIGQGYDVCPHPMLRGAKMMTSTRSLR